MSQQLNDKLILIKESLERSAIRSQAELIVGYKRAMQDIEKEVAYLYAKYTDSNGVLTISARQRIESLKQIENQVKEQAKKLGSLDESITKKAVINSAEAAYYQTSYEIYKATGANFAMLNPKFAERAIMYKVDGKTLSDRIWDNKEKLVNRVTRDVERAIITGKDLKPLIREIKRDYGSSAYESKRLLTNEVKNVVISSQLESFKESNVVEFLQWSSSRDALVRDDHADLDGQIFNINSDHPTPESEVNCRCALLPIIDIMVGRATQRESYREWENRTKNQ
jgi:SPP1 gp7 family putative phage head morphogenesis protein